MNIEYLLYVYLFICCSMILFNIVMAIVLKHRDKKVRHISGKFYHEIKRQIAYAHNNKKLETKDLKYLVKKLGHVNNMFIFDEILEKSYLENKEEVEDYLSLLNEIIIQLIEKYEKKSYMEKAYFVYIVKKYQLIKKDTTNTLILAMLKLLKEPNIYCLENAMQAIYASGNSDYVIRAIKIIDKNETFFHEKLLADGMLNYVGDHEELGNKIISEFFCFTVSTQVALLNFLRFDSDGYGDFIFKMLKDENNNDEVRYACIRYFGKYHFVDAYEYLLFLANKDNGLKWEYSAIASMALANYPGKETINILKSNLYSKNWYIRFNSSLSLEKLGLGYLDLIDVMEGKDRYAMEIIRYRFDVKKARRLYV